MRPLSAPSPIPSTNSYKRLVPGFEAPVTVGYAMANRSAVVRIPAYAKAPKNKRFELRNPDATCNPYYAFAAILMAGLDGIQNKIDPKANGWGPYDFNLFDLPEEEKAKIGGLPKSLEEALDALEQDHEYLTRGGVFPQRLLDIWVEKKRKEISKMNLDGYAVGGLAVGESHEEMYRILDAVVPHLPEDKPTYLMGVGTPANILEAVDRGVDFFDCVYPSRNGRHSHVYTNHGKLNLLNSKYELDPRPIEEGCGCPACRSYSRAYIRHLFKAKEMLGMRLCVLHNLYFYNKMMEEIRDAIEHHCYAEYKAKKLAGMMGESN